MIPNPRAKLLDEVRKVLRVLNTLVFLYDEVLHIELDWMDNLVRARCTTRLPLVISRDLPPASFPRVLSPRLPLACSSARNACRGL